MSKIDPILSGIDDFCIASLDYTIGNCFFTWPNQQQLFSAESVLQLFGKFGEIFCGPALRGTETGTGI